MKVYKIGIDIKRELATPLKGINTGDSVIFCVTLTDGGEIYDFTGVNIIKLSARLGDYNEYTIDLAENLKKTDPERGYLEFDIPQAFVNDKGMHKLQITLFKDDKKMATAQASYYVEEVLQGGDDVPDANTLSTYDNLMKNVSDKVLDAEKERVAAEEEREAEIEKLKAMSASAVLLEAGEEPTAELSKEDDGYSFVFGIPKGEKGEKGEQGIQGVKGDAFEIFKTYPSVDDMNVDSENVPEGKFVLIASNIEDEDNAKLFVKAADGFSFLTDMSGAKGIQGERGEQGIKGEKGDTGARGPQGEIGPKGPQGERGEKGEQGDIGPKGEQGIQGEKGVDGKTPVKGKDYFTPEDIDDLNDELNFIKDAHCELIEEITITENEVSGIIRSVEPDGKPYNFKSVSVWIEKTPWKVANVAVSEIYDTNGISLSSYRASLTASETAGKFHRAYYDVYAGHWFAIGCYGTPQTVPMPAQIWRTPKVYEGERIGKIHVYGYTTSFEVGTVIKIYGVRA